MRALRMWLWRIAGLFGASRRDRELAEELRAHLELEIEENMRRGMSRTEARRRALVSSGGLEAAKEAYRDQRGVPMLDHLLQDLRYGYRTLRRTPGFTAVAVLSLGVGIGATTAVFSLVNVALVQKLAVPAPNELEVLQWVSGARSPARSIDGSVRDDPESGGRVSTSFSVPMFRQLREHATTMSDVFAFAPLEQINVVDDGVADIADGQVVSGNYYRGLQLHAYRGRTIEPDDDRAAASPVAVITYEYWQRRFAGDPSIIGKRLDLNRMATTIIGVTPPGFTGTLGIEASPDVTVPMSVLPLFRSSAAADYANATFWWMRIMGRRAPGVATERARAELEPIVQRGALESAAAGQTAGPPPKESLVRLRLQPGDRGLDDGRASFKRAMTIMSLVVGLVLLIACANVANLLLTRATVRAREITVRLALGANRQRIVKQLLVESLLIVAAAEGLGLVVAQWGKNFLRQLTPDGQTFDLALDLRVFAATTVLSVLTALLFGLAPALRASRVDVADGLKDAGGRVRAAGRSLFARSLVVAQLAMSVVLLIYAALFVRSLAKLRAVDVGFNVQSVLVFRVDPRLSGYTTATIPPLYRRLHESLSALPSVQGVTFTRHAQLSGSRRRDDLVVPERPTDQDKDVLIDLVGPRFFETMQLPVRAGRALAPTDDERAPHVAVVNEALVRKFFASGNPLGRRVRLGGDEIEVVGVVDNAKYYSIRVGAEPIIYVSQPQHDQGQVSFAVRFSGDLGATVQSVRHAVRDVDKTLSMFDVRTQTQALDETLAEERLFAQLSLVFGLLAVALACIGVYGVISYSTARRTGEIGIRLALGARAGDIVWLIMRHTLALVAIGVAVGLAIGVQSTRLFAKVLFELSTTDPGSIAGAVAIISFVALAAAYIPATRARRVSPLVALRHE